KSGSLPESPHNPVFLVDGNQKGKRVPGRFGTSLQIACQSQHFFRCTNVSPEEYDPADAVFYNHALHFFRKSRAMKTYHHQLSDFLPQGHLAHVHKSPSPPSVSAIATAFRTNPLAYSSNCSD